MYKSLTSLLILLMLIPSVVEAKPRCKTKGKVTVCRMGKKPKYKKPIVPPGYYRPVPPRRVPQWRIN